ncbi:MAG: hypothetical protein HZB55_02085 [Deltaproteobacteria bacterium]|nr:hypothetical protein [Deltaproteobacteria bacterium]
MADAARNLNDEPGGDLPELDSPLAIAGAVGLGGSDWPKVQNEATLEAPPAGDDLALETLTWLGSYEVLIL